MFFNKLTRIVVMNNFFLLTECDIIVIHDQKKKKYGITNNIIYKGFFKINIHFFY